MRDINFEVQRGLDVVYWPVSSRDASPDNNAVAASARFDGGRATMIRDLVATRIGDSQRALAPLRSNVSAAWQLT